MVKIPNLKKFVPRTTVIYTQPVTPTMQFNFSSGALNLAWPAATAGDFVLQYADSLSPPILWRNIVATVTTNSGALNVALPTTNAQRSFRLAKGGNTSDAPPNMALIPAGSFTMGDTFAEGYSDELPLHSVYVSEFYMDRFEVSKALWDEVRAWALVNGYDFDNAGSGTATNHPVHTVNWYDAVKWCNARSEREGLTPAYYTDSSQAAVFKSGQIDLTDGCVKWAANGYRLPTEAEWEKAARGGLAGNHYPWPSDGGAYSDHINGSKANYTFSGDPYEGQSYETTPVGYYNGGQTPAGVDMANGYGLYDMAGNVWEWCWDRYQSNWYSQAGATQNDTRGPTSESYRVIRGGSWVNYTYNLRCAERHNVALTYAVITVGFRCVRGL